MTSFEEASAEALELVASEKATEGGAQTDPAPRTGGLIRTVAYIVIPAIALLLALGAGYLRYEYSSRHDAEQARVQSVQAAREATVAVLSYQAKSVDTDLGAARDRLTGAFLDAYTQLVNTVVIPGAKEKGISATAQVPAAASVSANVNHAVVLVFVNQTVVMGSEKPTTTPSSVRVTLDKVGDRWLISGFDPV